MGHSHLNPFGSPKSVSFSPALRRDLLLDQVNAINDLLVAQLDGYTSIVPEEFEMPRQVDGRRRDWVGSCPRAGEDANTNAKLFLKLWKPIEVLWHVSANWLRLAGPRNRSFVIIFLGLPQPHSPFVIAATFYSP